MTYLLLLCGCVSGDYAADTLARLRQALPAPSDTEGWGALIDVADKAGLAPAFWLAMESKDLLGMMPQALRSALQRRHMMNMMRNERIRAQGLDVIAICERLGVAPTILKGGAALFESPPELIGRRFMWDLDFLLPADAVEPVAQAMIAGGFKVTEEPNDDWVYTYPAMRRKGDVSDIELHHRVGQQRSLLSAATALRDALPIPREPRLRTLSPTHRVWHNIFHSQVQDQGHVLGLIRARQLVDLEHICRTHAGDIDWPALERLMRGAGMHGVLRARLHQAQQLVGLPWPLAEPPGLAARMHHRHAVSLLTSPRTMAVTQSLRALTAPFKKHHIDLIYGCGIRNPLKLALARLRHARVIASRHRGRLLDRLLLKRRFNT
ncbi:MAG: nucleotidyltransferase family protein [Sphingomonadales bacterium]